MGALLRRRMRHAKPVGDEAQQGASVDGQVVGAEV
jgi:hypothetical protein